MDRSIQRAVEDGKRNADGALLVKNWCAHVRIERMGGGGMIGAVTGLPIGHHGLACDHAPAGGVMCWTTRDAALDFYDRNCHDCKLRKPVGIPNILTWVSERNAEVAKSKAKEEAATRDAEARLASRRADRSALRVGLSPASADVVDQIEELDVQRSTDVAHRLLATASLAPDAFQPSVVDHIFGLLEARETWFDETGLVVLDCLKADPARLARCATDCLQRWSAVETAARTATRHRRVVSGSQVGAALPALIRLASPSREPFSDMKRPKIAPLVLINAAFPDEVKAALNGMLGGAPADVGLAACAIEVLTKRAPDVAARFARDLVSKLVRAPWVPDPEDYSHDPEEHHANDLRDGIVEAFLCDPNAVDTLLQNFKVGASEAGEARIFSIYSRVLRTGCFRKERSVREAHRLAFRRLLWEAPKATSEKVLGEIQEAVSHGPHELDDLAKEEVDHLIGAAILMDGRLVAFDAEPKPENSPLLDMMERGNRRSTLAGLRSSFVSWAAAGAAAAGIHAQYLGVLDGLPEDRDDFAACMIEHAVSLMETAEGLNAVLPSLYTALVGVFVIRRGKAARAIGELPWRQRENLPDLLLEAFLTTLTDPFIYVHHAGVMALGRFHLPEKYDGRVRVALWNVLLAHHKSTDHQDLVIECMELLANRYLAETERGGKAGAFLVSILKTLPPWRLSNELRVFARQLARADGAIDWLIAVLLDPQGHEHVQDRAIEAIEGLPSDVVYEHREKFAAIPAGDHHSSRFRVFNLVQVLTRAAAWAEAEHLAKVAVDSIPNTAREAAVRLIFELAHTVAAFEHMLARGDDASVTSLASRWQDLIKAKEANDRAIAQRPDPYRDVPRAS